MKTLVTGERTERTGQRVTQEKTKRAAQVNCDPPTSVQTVFIRLTLINHLTCLIVLLVNNNCIKRI
uniref:Uncharacterized protein n=1 Tax=Sphaeramia orbicularis TaxID=375764 RepID=A0A673AHR2_9TELE